MVPRIEPAGTLCPAEVQAALDKILPLEYAPEAIHDARSRRSPL